MKRTLAMVALVVLGMMLIGAGLSGHAVKTGAGYWDMVAQGTVEDGGFSGWYPDEVTVTVLDDRVSVALMLADLKVVNATAYESDGCFVEVANIRHEGRYGSAFDVLGWCPDEAESTGDVPFMFTAYGIIKVTPW